MCIVMGADTATNTQPAASPRRYMPFMRHSFLIALSILFGSFSSEAQKDTFIVRTNFSNQGQQEDYWAEKLFYEQYIKEYYPKYRGQIKVISSSVFSFDSLHIMLLNDPHPMVLTSIFKQGLLFPTLFTQNASVNDTLKIDALEELTFLKLPPTKKRFRLWCYTIEFLSNPTVYLFELSNKHASATTDLKTFIQGSSLTFLKSGWTIL